MIEVSRSNSNNRLTLDENSLLNEATRAMFNVPMIQYNAHVEQYVESIDGGVVGVKCNF